MLFLAPYCNINDTMKKNIMKITSLFIMSSMLLVQCNTPDNKAQPQEKQRKKIKYQITSAKQWMEMHKSDTQQLKLILAVNRIDRENFSTMDSIIVPNDVTADIGNYLSFPFDVAGLKNIKKIIFFSYPSQTFGAYENGKLTYTGPTNMGRKKDPTPSGIYYTNWKAEETISTFNDEWELLWNFNIENKEGIGWHQYALPGYPASHSCLRLNETDAKYLYNWADEWVVDEKNKDSVVVNGTPVIVFGTYNFDAPKPWLQLVTNPTALDISTEKIEELVAPHVNNIMAQQDKRKAAPQKPGTNQ